MDLAQLQDHVTGILPDGTTVLPHHVKDWINHAYLDVAARLRILRADASGVVGNKLPNPAFLDTSRDGRPDGWVWGSLGSPGVTSEVTVGGAYQFTIEVEASDPGTNPDFSPPEAQPAQAGTVWIASIEESLVSVGSGTPQCRIGLFWQGTGGLVDWSAFGPVGVHGYNPLSIAATAPTGTTGVSFLLECRGTGVGTYTVRLPKLLGGENTVIVPSDFLEAVWLRLGADDVFFVDDDVFHQHKDVGTSPDHTLGRVMGSAIELYPEPAAGAAYTLRYVQTPVDLQNPTDSPVLPAHLNFKLVHYARAQAYWQMGDQGRGEQERALYEDGLPGPNTGRPRQIPGPIQMVPVATVFDLDPEARHV